MKKEPNQAFFSLDYRWHIGFLNTTDPLSVYFMIYTDKLSDPLSEILRVFWLCDSQEILKRSIPPVLISPFVDNTVHIVLNLRYCLEVLHVKIVLAHCKQVCFDFF